MPRRMKCPPCKDCGGTARMVSSKWLVDGSKRRSCKCKVCGNHINLYTYEGPPTLLFDNFLKNVKRPPKRLTALAMFSETLVIWREVNAG